jgi:hypothetical protein
MFIETVFESISLGFGSNIVFTNFDKFATVAQLVWFAYGLRATEFCYHF